MKLSIIISVFLLGIIYLGSASFEFVNQWNGGWQGVLHIDINQETHGWMIYLEFDISIAQLEVYKGHVIENIDNRQFKIGNEPWDADLMPGTVFDLEMIVRYPAGTPFPNLILAQFNGEDVDLGSGPVPTGGSTQTQPSTTAGPTTTPGSTTTRRPGEGYDYGEVIGLSLKFYEAQRSGKLPSDNRIPWRGDSFLDDQGDGGHDLSGGYFDAGDHVKFGFPFAAFTTIMAWGLLDYKDGYDAAGEYENGLKALRWSLDYFIKAHPEPQVFYGQVGDGHVDHSFWGRPEDFTGSRPAFKITAAAPGSDLAGEAAASFAAAYMIFNNSDPNYATECLRHARELYNFANQYRGKYSDSIPNASEFYNSWSGYGDELAWAASWLYRATMEEAYLTDVRAHWAEFMIGVLPEEFGWDDKKAGIQVLLAKVVGDAVYKTTAQSFCDSMVSKPRTPKGLCHISQWGALRHVSNVAFVCLQAADAGIKPDEYRAFAKSQIDYILGDGGRSYVIGYGSNPPQRPHHRGSSCPDAPAVCDWQAFNSPDPNPQILYGALVGGPDNQDQYEDKRDDYIKNEVATDYNAGFQSALAGLNSLKVRSL